MKRLVPPLIISLILALLFVSAPQIGTVSAATGTVAIKADGSVSPSDAPILRNGDVYTLTADINGTSSVSAGLLIERDNMTLDGAGFTLRGVSFSGSGIYLTNTSPSLTGRTNVTIKNVRIEGFNYGIQLYESSNNTVSNCTIIGSQPAGQRGIGVFILGFTSSRNNMISGNSILNSYIGIEISGLSDNTLQGNTVSGSGNWGLYIVATSTTTITSNTVSDNVGGVFIAPISYFGPNGTTAQHIIMKGNIIRNNQVNFDVANPSYTLTSADFPYDIDSSNTINGKPIYFWRNERDKTVPSDAGFVGLINSTNIKVENLQLSGNGYGIFLFGTRNSRIARNTLTGNRLGMEVWDSTGNEIVENNINENNGWGIEFRGTQTGNIFIRNNFINNRVNGTLQVSIDKRFGLGLGNTWDNGKVGNYWSDYKSRYQNATQLGYSGTYNVGFYINENNVDNHPLMNPVVLESTPPTISITSPENKSYATNVKLTFVLNEPTPWTAFSLDGQANVTTTGDSPLNGLSEGSHSVSAYAEDIMGNIGFTTVQFTIDRTSPKIKILSPENVTHSQNVTLSFHIDEISTMSYSLDGLTAVTTSGNVTLTNLEYGMHNVTVYAKDPAGNLATETFTFTVAPETGTLELLTTLILPIVAAASIGAVAVYLLIRRRKKASKPKPEPSATSSEAQS